MRKVVVFQRATLFLLMVVVMLTPFRVWGQEGKSDPLPPPLATASQVPAANNATGLPGLVPPTPIVSEIPPQQLAEPDKPWQIPQPDCLKQLGINVFGWLDQGFTANALSPINRSNGPVATNDRSNDYQLNQAWLGFERAVKTDGCGFDIGGRVDLVYGTDWRYGDSPGLENRINSRTDYYGLVIPQFYLDVGWNDLTARIGHFAAGIGYEQIPGPANLFYSHSYAMGYSEPLLLTGFQFDYKWSDNLHIYAGLNNGWTQFEDFDQRFNFLGGFRWQSDDKKTNLSFMIDVGPQDPRVNDPQFAYALVFQQQLTENLKYVAQHNLGGTENGNPRTLGYAGWYGLDQYLIYKINNQLSLATRFEWFDDAQGSRVAGVGNLNNGWTALPGFEGNFFEWTNGFNYQPCRNLNIRPELRYDWYSGSRNLADQLPFGDGKHHDQILAALDVIFVF